MRWKTLYIEHFLGTFAAGKVVKSWRWLDDSSYDVAHAIDIRFTIVTRILSLFPGSATWSTGFLLSTVRDLIPTSDLTNVMLDVSFTAHMPGFRNAL